MIVKEGINLQKYLIYHWFQYILKFYFMFSLLVHFGTCKLITTPVIVEFYIGAQCAQCCLWFHEPWLLLLIRKNSVWNTINSHFKDRLLLNGWMVQLLYWSQLWSTKTPGQGKPSVSEVMIEQVWQTIVHSTGKPMRYASLELNIPRFTEGKCKWLAFKPYKLQIMQALNEGEKQIWTEICVKTW